MAAKKKTNTAVDVKEDVKERDKALAKALAQIDKDYGAGSIMKMGERSDLDIERIPTGSLNLDYALGGGVPKGRIIEIYGAESSGKTTISLHIIAEAQKRNGVVAFIDAEHALDPAYAKTLGVNIDELLISQPDSGEQALEIADVLVRSGAIDLIVIDSVAALVPQQEIDGLMGDQQMGLHARLMAKGLRKLTGNLKKSNTTLIFINQLREKIGGLSFNGAPTTTTTGGRALKFFASVRMEVKKISSIKQGENNIIGSETTVKVTKNKVSPPFRVAQFQILFGKGISKVGEYMDIAEHNNILSKSGAWFKYGEDVKVQGRENLRDMFEKNADLFERLKADVNEFLEKNKAELSDLSAKDVEEDENDTDNSEE